MKGYGDIRLLEKDVADKIAAGEVVERPLSVVKELTENSIDAGATSISVEIEKGGREYIRVTDNGCGIAPEQVSLAFMRHATSKIRLEEDLNGIQTLGFRGEALASIAAVSKTELITKTAGEKAGTRIRIHGGETVECGSVASDEGTTIIVRDLFYNTPARRKFLRSDSAEASLVIDYLSKMAIACPDVRIRVKNNGSILFSTLGGGDLLKAIQTVYGAAAEYRLLPVDYSEGGTLRLRGYVSAPTGFRKNRRMQICFVNGRLVKDKTLDNAIDEAYRDKLFDGCYPVVFLFLETDPSAVDVNIHPHKTEVKFYDERGIYEFAVRGIRKALLAPDAENVGEMMAQKAEVPTPAASPSVSYPGWEPPAECSVAETVNTVSWNEVNNINLSSTEPDDYFSQLRQKEESGRQQTLEETFKEISPQRLTFSSLELVGQVFATYIVLRDENYVYFMDQHAAHERVMYERLLESFNSEDTQTQMLLMPKIIQLPAADKAAAEGKTDLLRSLGYVIEDFGPNEFIVKEVPAFFDESEAEEFLRSVVESDFKDTQARRDEIIMASCKSAVKGNDVLAPEEIRQLLIDLDLCENPYNCPHGRPTYIRFSEYDLEKMFKRK